MPFSSPSGTRLSHHQHGTPLPLPISPCTFFSSSWHFPLHHLCSFPPHLNFCPLSFTIFPFSHFYEPEFALFSIFFYSSLFIFIHSTYDSFPSIISPLPSPPLKHSSTSSFSQFLSLSQIFTSIKHFPTSLSFLSPFLFFPFFLPLFLPILLLLQPFHLTLSPITYLPTFLSPFLSLSSIPLPSPSSFLSLMNGV